jgi:prefoldin alpha subunit
VSEEELRRAATVLDNYRAQLEALGRQSDLVRQSLEEFRRARETVVRYQEAGASKEVLVPIGANSFLRATSADPGHVLVGIGSDLVIEDASETAVRRLEMRIQSLEEAGQAVGGKIEEVQARIEAQSAAVEELYAKEQGAAPG